MTFSEYSAFRDSTDLASTHSNLPPGIYGALGLAGESGEAADKIKKLYRDSHGADTPEWRAGLVKELGDILWYLDRVAADFGYTLEDVARANIAKLNDRKSRGVLGGSGDDR